MSSASVFDVALPITSSKLLSEAEYNRMRVAVTELAAIAYWLDKPDIPDHSKVALAKGCVARALGATR